MKEHSKFLAGLLVMAGGVCATLLGGTPIDPRYPVLFGLGIASGIAGSLLGLANFSALTQEREIA